MDKHILRLAFIQSLPIFFSYLFVSMSYGILMSEAGLAWYISLLVSFTVYTGAFQFVLITFLSSGVGILTVAITALFMNSRQCFYSLTMLEDFKCYTSFRRLYMIYTMTDETYAINIALNKEDPQRRSVMFLVAMLSRCYWILGSVLGGILGQLIPVSLDGIDFCMTALFLIIFMGQWETAESHLPAIIGLTVGILCLLLLGASVFMLPALLLTSAMLLLISNPKKEADINVR